MRSTPKKFSVLLSIKTQVLPHKTPNFVVNLNEVRQQSTDIQDNVTIFDMLAHYGDNRLTVDFLNKDHTDTVVDLDGKIIRDLNVELVGLQVDNIEITNLAKQQVRYLAQDGQYENTYGFMHKNGRLTFEFQCPIFYFLRNVALVK